IEFVTREMLHPDGGFYSAIDADSEGVEGKYYTWDDAEITDILVEAIGDLFKQVYHMTPEGNFEGKNIPNFMGTDLSDVARANNLTILTLKVKLEKRSEEHTSELQ